LTIKALGEDIFNHSVNLEHIIKNMMAQVIKAKYQKIPVD